jgi:sugar lactone lactonase YvrE
LRTYHIGRPVGAAIPAGDGCFLLAEADGFSVVSPDGVVSPVLPMLKDKPLLRFNDAKTDPEGHVLAGTMAYNKSAGAGTLYRLDHGPVATPVLRGADCLQRAWLEPRFPHDVVCRLGTALHRRL